MRLSHDPGDAHDGDRREPDDHDGTEQRTDGRRAARLNQKQDQQHADGHRHDVRLEQVRRQAQPFNGAQHRDGRRDHAVAIEQRRAEQPERDEERAAPAPGLRMLGHERDQRQHAALALVVGPHDENQVFDGDEERQRPENQRQHAHHVVRRRRDRVDAVKTLAE